MVDLSNNNNNNNTEINVNKYDFWALSKQGGVPFKNGNHGILGYPIFGAPNCNPQKELKKMEPRVSWMVVR